MPWAIQELRKYIRTMNNVELSIARRTTAGPAVIVGLRKDLSIDDQRALPPPAQGYDGYAVVARGDAAPRIIVGGENGCGVVYGVYDLLERLGCRWFYPTQELEDLDAEDRVGPGTSSSR